MIRSNEHLTFKIGYAHSQQQTIECNNYGLTKDGLKIWVRNGDIFTYYVISQMLYYVDIHDRC